MYEKMFEQAESFFKPMNEIFTLNMELVDKLREKQSSLMTEVWADTIDLMKDISSPDAEIDKIVATQKEFWEGMSEKVSNNAQESFDIVSGMQGKVGDIVSDAMDDKKDGSLEAVAEQPAKAKPAPKKKSVAKKTASSKKAAQSELLESDA